MELERIWKSANTEADWLRYYGNLETRTSEKFDDENFYDRMVGIGYTKVVMPLYKRCSLSHITSKNPVMESNVSDLCFTSGPRDHSKNIYTPLEYMIGKRIGFDQLVKIIRNERIVLP